MNVPKVVLGVFLALAFLGSLVRIARDVEVDDPVDVTVAAVAAAVTCGIYSGLFVALAHA